MMTPETNHRPTGVYRMYDATGRLLYIGQSQRMAVRMRMHEKHSWWFGLVADMTIEMRPNRLSAMAAEAVAIQEEQPPFNVRHTGRKESDWSHLSAADAAVARAWIKAGKPSDYRHLDLPRFLWYHLAGFAAVPLASARGIKAA